jgi:RimJ/RimL family protein N-acetyltransferase
MARHNEWGQPIGPTLENWNAPPHPPRQTLAGRFCSVVPLEMPTHADALFEALSKDGPHPRWTYLPYGPFSDRDSFETWLAAGASGTDPLFFAIVERETNTAAGLCSYLRIAPEAGSIEVGHLNYSDRLRKRPASTEAMYLMMKNAFELGYRRYEWKCDALNAPSRSAAERLGFTHEGIFRNATVYKGRSRDTAWYAVTVEDFPALERAFTDWLAPSNFDARGEQRTRLSELTAGLRARG